MNNNYGPEAFMDDAALTAAAIVKAHLVRHSASDSPAAQDVLERFIETFGIQGCRVLVAALAELVVAQAEDREALLARIEEQELTVLTEAHQRDQ